VYRINKIISARIRSSHKEVEITRQKKYCHLTKSNLVGSGTHHSFPMASNNFPEDIAL
jgi:hypothetical protein